MSTCIPTIPNKKQFLLVFCSNLEIFHFLREYSILCCYSLNLCFQLLRKRSFLSLSVIIRLSQVSGSRLSNTKCWSNPSHHTVHLVVLFCRHPSFIRIFSSGCPMSIQRPACFVVISLQLLPGFILLNSGFLSLYRSSVSCARATPANRVDSINFIFIMVSLKKNLVSCYCCLLFLVLFLWLFFRLKRLIVSIFVLVQDFGILLSHLLSVFNIYWFCDFRVLRLGPKLLQYPPSLEILETDQKFPCSWVYVITISWCSSRICMTTMFKTCLTAALLTSNRRIVEVVARGWRTIKKLDCRSKKSEPASSSSKVGFSLSIPLMCKKDRGNESRDRLGEMEKERDWRRGAQRRRRKGTKKKKGHVTEKRTNWLMEVD